MSRGTYEQRAFDAMYRASVLLSVEEVAQKMGCTVATAKAALIRLNRGKKLRVECQNRVWRYGLKPGAERPRDRRGEYEPRGKEAA